MVKRRILLVDHDDPNQHTLARVLLEAGFLVACHPDPHAALVALSRALPDALLVATALPYLNGFELVRRTRNLPGGEHLPVIFVAHHFSREDKASTLELGAVDCMGKPLLPADVVARLQTIFKGTGSAAPTPTPADEFTGELHEFDVAALCNMMQSGKKSGTLVVQRGAAHAFVYFIRGQVIDAETRLRRGAQALYQLLRWHEGSFSLHFAIPNRPVTLTTPTHTLLLEGMHRFDTWKRWLMQLPPLEAVLHLQPPQMAAVGKASVNDPVLHLVDGRRTIMHIIEASPMGDVETAEALARRLARGHIALAPIIQGAPPAAPPRPSSDPRAHAAAPLLLGPAEPPSADLHDSADPETPRPAAPLWRRPWFWLWTTSVGAVTVGWVWSLAQR